MITPLRLSPAKAWRTYLGGRLIAALHGETAEDTHFPEEWILSTVTAKNAGREHIVEGLSCLEKTGEPLRDWLSRHPEALGPGRSETGMLMKLLDAAERLGIQVHPSRENARRYFNSPFGKTECWHILGGREVNGEKPCVYMGFREGVTREKWTRLFEAQDVDGMLNCMHRIECHVGDTFLIRGGLPHAIGAGCFLAEIQEPTDITLRTERHTLDGTLLPEEKCHMGIGFENMLSFFDYDGCGLEESLKRFQIPSRVLSEEKGAYRLLSVLSWEDTPYFALEKAEIEASMPLPAQDRFCGIYILKGRGTLTYGESKESIFPGVQYFIPAFCSCAVEAEEPVTLLRYYGPKVS